MFFLPRQTVGGSYYDTGLISEKLVSQALCEVTISLNTIAIDFKGLTINFGENYPVDFDIVGSTGQTIEFRDNTKSEWSTEEVLLNTTYIKLVFRKMKNPQSRLRIYSIRFGYGLVYYNDSVMDSSLDSYISPIGADVPQIDFSVTLKNYDHYFNVDNPKSAINYLETGQEMDIMYGYQHPDSDEIEWICKLSEHWRYLQVQYSLTDTGRVIQKINPKRLTAMRRKMKKLAPKLTEKEFTDWYKSWFKNHYKIMSKRQRSNMDILFNQLKEVTKCSTQLPLLTEES